ncbi:MAG: cobalamin biosynthesis protein CbiG [Desulfovibrio sp.]|nr:cobalamin biosynthesis protein CbiG [Desulfovibrio sp.]
MNTGREGGVAVYALTRQGAQVARRLARSLASPRLFLPERLATHGEAPFARLAQCLAANWALFGKHVVVAATGIVVRCLAPLLAGKAHDPAVVVVDQRGRFAVSLLSGHLGGANDLARQVADILGGQAVITTATDLEGLPSLEVAAREAGLKVMNLSALAGLSGRLLDGETVAVWDPGDWLWSRLDQSWPGLFHRQLDESRPGVETAPLAWVDWRDAPVGEAWLVLRPPCLMLGMGCNRGAGADEMEQLIRNVLARHGLSPASAACLASVAAKRDEPGLIELAARLGLPLFFFSAEQLDAVEAPNPSRRVMAHMGTGSVCEAAAILAAKGGSLLAQKQTSKNATCAVALMACSG